MIPRQARCLHLSFEKLGFTFHGHRWRELSSLLNSGGNRVCTSGRFIVRWCRMRMTGVCGCFLVLIETSRFQTIAVLGATEDGCSVLHSWDVSWLRDMRPGTFTITASQYLTYLPPDVSQNFSPISQIPCGLLSNQIRSRHQFLELFMLPWSQLVVFQGETLVASIRCRVV